MKPLISTERIIVICSGRQKAWLRDPPKQRLHFSPGPGFFFWCKSAEEHLRFGNSLFSLPSPVRLYNNHTQEKLTSCDLPGRTNAIPLCLTVVTQRIVGISQVSRVPNGRTLLPKAIKRWYTNTNTPILSRFYIQVVSSSEFWAGGTQEVAQWNWRVGTPRLRTSPKFLLQLWGLESSSYKNLVVKNQHF